MHQKKSENTREEKEIMIEMIYRDRDMLTGCDDLEHLHTFKHLPINFGVTTQEECKDEFADAKWMISKGSGMIQLGELVPEEILYAESHHAGNAKIWQEHYELFADFVEDNVVGDTILEIGGGNGNLNHKYCRKYEKVSKWYIIEPSNIKPLEGVKAEYIRRFFDKEFKCPIEVKACKNIVHSHLMEHILDLSEFMQKSAEILDEGGMMIFSIPNLREEMRRKYSNALMFEHTYFLAEEYIDILMKCYGFEIKNKKYFREDHSIFFAVQKVSGAMKMVENTFLGKYEENKLLFEEYVQYYKNLVTDLNVKLESIEEGRKVYLFGAHVFSQFLLANGLEIGKIECVLDNDQLKQEKRLYGTSFMVHSPKILADVKNPVVILKCGAYDEEIMTDILDNINSDVLFLR